MSNKRNFWTNYFLRIVKKVAFMKRYKITVLSLLILLSISFISCTKPKEPAVNVSDILEQITNKIVKDYNLSTEETLNYKKIDFQKEESKDIFRTMKLNKDTIDEGFYIFDSTKKTSDRIMIVKAKKDTDIKQIVDGFKKMQKAQEKEWKKKNKKEYQKVKDGLVETKDKYVYYIVYDDMKGINTIIVDGIVKSKS